MFVDTVAFVAITCKEPELISSSTCIARAKRRCTSQIIRLTTYLILGRRLDRDPGDVRADLDEFLTETRITVVSISRQHRPRGRGGVSAIREGLRTPGTTQPRGQPF